MKRLSRHLLLGLALTSTLAIEMRGQTGVWVFDGWPHEKNGYFAGQTEVLVDGARVRSLVQCATTGRSFVYCPRANIASGYWENKLFRPYFPHFKPLCMPNVRF